MVTNSPPTPEDDEIDEDTLASFGKVLKKYHAKDPQWLTTLFPDFSPVGSKQPSPDLTTFLQSMLAEEKTSKATMLERLEAAMSLMTPEQLTQLRSATGKKENAGGGPTPAAPPTPPKVEPPKKRKWL